MDFETIWQRIVDCAGQEFRTQRKLPFTYKVVGDYVFHSRTNQPIAKIQFEKAAALPELAGPGQINQLVRGASYVFAILTDERIR